MTRFGDFDGDLEDEMVRESNIFVDILNLWFSREWRLRGLLGGDFGFIILFNFNLAKMTQPLFAEYFNKVLLPSFKINYAAQSPDGTLIALAYSNGQMMIVSQEHKVILFKFKVFNPDSALTEPCYDLTWHPTTTKQFKEWKLLGACHDGGVMEWRPSM